MSRRTIQTTGIALILSLTLGVAAAAASTWTVGFHGAAPSSARATTINAPTGGGAGSATATTLAITWTAPGAGAPPASYRVSRCSGASCTSVAVGSGTCSGAITTTSCTDSGLTASTTYTYTVTSLRNNWTSAASTSFQGTTSASAAGQLHISALSSSNVARQNQNFWHATVTVTVKDANGNAVSGVTVTGSWSPTSGATRDCSALTDANGQCNVVSGNSDFPNGTNETWTPANLAKSGYTYNSAANTPASITITAP